MDLLAPLRRSRRAIARLGLPFGILLATERGPFVRGAVAVPVAGVASLVLPWLLGRALDLLRTASADDLGGADEARASLTWILTAFVTVAVVEGGLRWVARHQLIRASRRVEERLKNVLIDRLQRLPLGWFDSVRRGDLISRATQDVELLRFAIGPTILYGAQSLVVVPGGLALMLWISWPVALAVCGVMALLLLATLGILPRMHVQSKRVQETIGEIAQTAQEDFAGQRVWAVFGRADQRVGTMRALSDRYVDDNVRLVRTRAVFDLAIHATRSLVILAVVVVGALEAARGRVTMGELVTFLGVMGIMMWPLIALGFLLASMQRSLAAAERIGDVLDAATEPGLPGRIDRFGDRLQEEAPGRAAATSPPSVSLRGLTFRYREDGPAALEDVSVDVAPGGFLGLVGPIGGGRSTLLSLVLRLREPPPGTVFVDREDVLGLDPEALRARFAVAEQEPFLFSDTIRGNVLFGAGWPAGAVDDEALAARARDACEAARLSGDLERFRAGIDTVVGERGTTLSGGQKQRTQLARAIAADRPGLVLDDAFSAVDVRTEAAILASLRRQRRGRTALVAAHRLATVREADEILWLEGGRVLERGTHDELVRAGGRYAATWRRQAETAALAGGSDDPDGARHGRRGGGGT